MPEQTMTFDTILAEAEAATKAAQGLCAELRRALAAHPADSPPVQDLAGRLSAANLEVTTRTLGAQLALDACAARVERLKYETRRLWRGVSALNRRLDGAAPSRG
jgi:hypothetical protein